MSGTPLKQDEAEQQMAEILRQKLAPITEKYREAARRLDALEKAHR